MVNVVVNLERAFAEVQKKVPSLATSVNDRLQRSKEQMDAVSLVVKQIEGVLGKPSGAFRRVANQSVWGTISSGHEKVKVLEERMDAWS